MNVLLTILHAAFDGDRRERMDRLLGQIRAEAPNHYPDMLVQVDREREGCVATWQRAMTNALRVASEGGFTHVCLLQDDSVICRGFGRALDRMVMGKPDDTFDLFVNHPRAGIPGAGWSQGIDGFTYQGGVQPTLQLEDMLQWRKDALLDEDAIPPDLGVNLWAIARRRRVLKPRFSLVQHNDGGRSLMGNEGDLTERRGMFFVGADEPGMLDDTAVIEAWNAEPAEHLGRTYVGNHRGLLSHLRPSAVTPDIIEGVYLAERHGAELSTVPSLFHARCTGASPEERLAEQAYGVHRFLASNQTHLLLDRDPLDPASGGHVWTRPQVTRRLAGSMLLCKRLAGEVTGDPEAVGAPVWMGLDWTDRSS